MMNLRFRRALLVLAAGAVSCCLLLSAFDSDESRSQLLATRYHARNRTASFFQRSAAEINECPLDPDQRPQGCPKRDDPQAHCG